MDFNLKHVFDPQFIESEPLPVWDAAERSKICTRIIQNLDDSKETHDGQQQANTARRKPKVCKTWALYKHSWHVMKKEVNFAHLKPLLMLSIFKCSPLVVDQPFKNAVAQDRHFQFDFSTSRWQRAPVITHYTPVVILRS